mmetsp:Transcript_49420/g.72498  ORF Transcript_49420/g.72498 Transcript_49420/m.72498 type:complete len:217 (+) Transcript_49420:224-874(+)
MNRTTLGKADTGLLKVLLHCFAVPTPCLVEFDQYRSLMPKVQKILSALEVDHVGPSYGLCAKIQILLDGFGSVKARIGFNTGLGCVGEELGRSLVKPCHSAFLALSQKCGKRVKIACPMRQYLCHRQHTLESPIRTAVWTHFWVRGQKLNTKRRKKNNPGLSFSHRVLSILRFAFGVTLRTRGSFGMVRLAAASSFSHIFVVYLLPGLKSLAAARA